jgi:hypothetical protein
MEWPAVVLVVVMLAASGYAVWRNMSDGIGSNRGATRYRGISGERGIDYSDGDLS